MKKRKYKYNDFASKVLKKENNIIDNYFRYQEYLSSKQYGQPAILTHRDFYLSKKKMEFVVKLYNAMDITDDILEFNPHAVGDYIYGKKKEIDSIRWIKNG